MKYKGITKIGTEFGELLGKRIAKEGFADYDYVIPVPIHQSKKRERGYNQSEFIAKSVAKILNCNYNSQLLKRKKYTNSQTLLDTTERKKNIQNVFASYNDKAVELVNGKDILIVDDVLTTGSTINECARILINMGANSVDVATLGHA